MNYNTILSVFVDFLSREGHFRLKKQINYKKNLVWKSVLIEFVHVHVHVLYIFWNCFAFVYMYCIHKLYFNSLCICSEQHLSFHIMYCTWSAKIGQKTSWSLKSCYIRSCTRSPLLITYDVTYHKNYLLFQKSEWKFS